MLNQFTAFFPFVIHAVTSLFAFKIRYTNRQKNCHTLKEYGRCVTVHTVEKSFPQNE
jgi:hypothetical protein